MVDRQRVEQLVGEQDALEGIRQRRTGGCQPLGDVAKRRGLSGAGDGARFDQMQADRVVEIGVMSLCGTQDVGGEPSISRTGFDQIETLKS